jgi:hypothetical protein
MADEQNEYERCADICDKIASNLRSHSEKSDVNLDVLAGGIIVASTLAERLRLEKTAKPAADPAQSAPSATCQYCDVNSGVGLEWRNGTLVHGLSYDKGKLVDFVLCPHVEAYAALRTAQLERERDELGVQN